MMGKVGKRWKLVLVDDGTNDNGTCHGCFFWSNGCKNRVEDRGCGGYGLYKKVEVTDEP